MSPTHPVVFLLMATMLQELLQSTLVLKTMALEEKSPRERVVMICCGQELLQLVKARPPRPIKSLTYASLVWPKAIQANLSV